MIIYKRYKRLIFRKEALFHKWPFLRVPIVQIGYQPSKKNRAEHQRMLRKNNWKSRAFSNNCIANLLKKIKFYRKTGIRLENIWMTSFGFFCQNRHKSGRHKSGLPLYQNLKTNHIFFIRRKKHEAKLRVKYQQFNFWREALLRVIFFPLEIKISNKFLKLFT